MANRVNLGNIIGATGATGPQGPAGQNGADGLTPYIQNGTWWIGSQDTNVIAKGNEWYYGTEIPTTQGNNGDLYLNTSTNDVYKKESGIWGLITNIKGAKGDKGDKGDTALSVTVGTVTTASSDTPASVTNSGTSTDLVLDFVIPKGETGEQGEKGDTGASSVFVGGFLADTISFDSDPQGQIDNKLSGNFGSENAGKYLQVDNNGNVQAVSSDAENDVIDGYYYNGAFYEDSEHTIQLVGASGKIYIDLVENLQYRYNGSSYVPMTADLSDYATIDYVDDRFNGAAKAISFSNYSAMITEFNALDDDVYNIGQDINIVTLEVPDLWISSIQQTSVPYTYVDDETFTSALATNGYVQVGYYRLSALETQKVDLTDYVTTNTVQTVTGKKTIDAEMTFTNSSAAGTNNLTIRNDNGYNAKIKMGSTENIRLMTVGTYFGATVAPINDNTIDLGVSNTRWKDLYVAGNISDGTNSVKVADLLESQFNVINASDITGTTLTQAQLDIITNGNPTIIKGTFLGYDNPLLVQPTTVSGNTRGMIIGNKNGGTYSYISCYQITSLAISEMTSGRVRGIFDKVDFGYDANITKDGSNRLNLNYSNDAKVKVGSAETTIKNRIGADSDNSQDIGRAAVRWKDLYLAGNLTDGTNSISIANIANKSDIPTLLTFTNTSVSTWTADNTYTGYGYKASITLTGVTADMIPQVIFGVTEATSGNYLPIAESYAGGIYIYSKVNDAITIPTIIVQKAGA